MPRHLMRSVLFGWLLLQAQRNGDWSVIGLYDSQSACEDIRGANVLREAVDGIGSALADQPADNPVRQQALNRAVRRLDERYRCARKDS